MIPSQGSLLQTLQEAQPTLFFGIPRYPFHAFNIFSFLSFIFILFVFSFFHLLLFLSPLSSSMPSHFLLNSPLFLFCRVYEKMMEQLQERCSSVSGFKRVISTWAKKKGLKGNENRQKKWDQLVPTSQQCTNFHVPYGDDHSAVVYFLIYAWGCMRKPTKWTNCGTEREYWAPWCPG